ncbi:hypothetical protein C8R41DRAFT_918530 [Lentinula lateritia]|uniref:Uncharacterized protein n=1 Tax=Lentinula lateritia TaxID=40482 RepID=A0ABQ8VJA6_9AGAR|nr:hypothetical protein C8R41DRAFT_918530 [Lentinula lateritia]
MWTLFKDKGSGSLYRKFQNFPSGYLQTSSDASFISHLIDTLEDLASYNEELDRLRTLTTRVADKQMTFVVQHPPFGDSLLRHYQRNFTLFSIYAEEDRQFHLVTLVFHNTAAYLNNCFRLLVKVFLAACHATQLDLILDYRFIYEEDIALLMHPNRWRSISFATYHIRVGKEVFGAFKDGPELSYLKVASPRHLILRPERREDKRLDLLHCALTATHLEIREHVRKPIIITDEVLQTLNIPSASDSAVPFSNRNNWADHTPSSSPSTPASQILLPALVPALDVEPALKDDVLIDMIQSRWRLLTTTFSEADAKTKRARLYTNSA